MSITARMGIPFIAAGQAQKEVTHAEGLVYIDALGSPEILDRDLTAPPGGPSDGQTWLVATGGTGDWAGQDGKIAYFADGAWTFFAPFTGLRAFIADVLFGIL